MHRRDLLRGPATEFIDSRKHRTGRDLWVTRSNPWINAGMLHPNHPWAMCIQPLFANLQWRRLYSFPRPSIPLPYCSDSKEDSPDTKSIPTFLQRKATACCPVGFFSLSFMAVSQIFEDFYHAHPHCSPFCILSWGSHLNQTFHRWPQSAHPSIWDPGLSWKSAVYSQLQLKSRDYLQCSVRWSTLQNQILDVCSWGSRVSRDFLPSCLH